MGDVVFFNVPDNTPGYEKFYTDSGEIGILTRGTQKEGTVCENFGCIWEIKEGYFSVTFRVNTDYRGVTFYAKDTPENIAILKSLIIKK
ncbi:MAG: hypothetical protein WDK96_03720 [Candidatus Paceibacterota bacterium]|jgi:hypothetical protein